MSKALPLAVKRKDLASVDAMPLACLLNAAVAVLKLDE